MPILLPRFLQKNNLSQKASLPVGWEQIDGWLSLEVAQLLNVLAKNLPKNSCIVEIGSWMGRSTVCLATAGPTSVYAIDPHTGSQEHRHDNPDCNTFKQFTKNIEAFNLTKSIHPIKLKAEEAAADFSHPIGLLWIDGSHDYQDVKKDLELWFDKLLPGGWILFHDSKWPGVRQVLWEDIYTHPLLSTVHRIEDTTFAQKLSSPNPVFQAINRILLKKEQVFQECKRLKRRLKKNLRKRASAN